MIEKLTASNDNFAEFEQQYPDHLNDLLFLFGKWLQGEAMYGSECDYKDCILTSIEALCEIVPRARFTGTVYRGTSYGAPLTKFQSWTREKPVAYYFAEGKKHPIVIEARCEYMLVSAVARWVHQNRQAIKNITSDGYVEFTRAIAAFPYEDEAITLSDEIEVISYRAAA